MKIYHIEDLCQLLRFGKSKVLMMARKGIIPVTKIGKTYIITEKQLFKWLDENEGKEIFLD